MRLTFNAQRPERSRGEEPENGNFLETEGARNAVGALDGGANFVPRASGGAVFLFGGMDLKDLCGETDSFESLGVTDLKDLSEGVSITVSVSVSSLCSSSSSGFKVGFVLLSPDFFRGVLAVFPTRRAGFGERATDLFGLLFKKSTKDGETSDTKSPEAVGASSGRIPEKDGSIFGLLESFLLA